MRTLNLTVALLLTIAIVGCQQMPGTREQQTTAAGAVTGAAAGAALADEDDSLLGALLGGALGAGGGYLVGARTDWFGGDRAEASAQARQAVRDAQINPVTVQEALSATTADIDQDGFVTMDELIAMEDAGLTDEQILQRLRATNAVFDLTPEQEDRLVNSGLSEDVVYQLESINRTDRDEIIGQAR